MLWDVGFFEFAVAGAVATFAAVRWFADGRGRRHWIAAGKALGLAEVYARGDDWFMQGLVGGYPVVAKKIGAKAGRTQIIVGGNLASTFGLRPENTLSRIVNATDLQLDDAPFDRAVRITGDETAALAFLDPANRKRWLKASQQGVRLETGEISLITDTPSSAALSLEDTVRALVRLARGLDLDEGSVAIRLARRARTDPIPSVRRRALEALPEVEIDPPLLASVLRAARGDDNAGVRLAAAELSGPEGWTTAAEIALDDAVIPEVRIDAMSVLGAQSPDTLRPLLPELAETWALQSTVARWAAHFDEADLLAQFAGPDLPAAVALDVIEAQQRNQHQTALITLLEHSDRDVKLAAIAALAEVGGRAAQPALRPLTSGVTTHAQVKAAARDALQRVMARVGGEAGGLALAEPTADGGLALLPDD